MKTNYRVIFNNNNTNCFNLYKSDNLTQPIKSVVCPPVNYSCDLLRLSDKKVSDGYTYNFDGLVIITSPKYRKVYCNGKLLAWVRRTKEKKLSDFKKQDNPLGIYMTLGALKDFVKRMEDKNIPDNTPILGERVEDYYFEYNNWETFTHFDEFLSQDYHPLWCVSYEKESGIVLFDFHY